MFGRWEWELKILVYVVVVVVLTWFLYTTKPYVHWWLHGIPMDSSFPGQQFQIPRQRVDDLKRELEEMKRKE